MLSSLLNIGAGALGKFLFQGVSLFAEHRKNKLNREYDLKERAMDLDFQRITLENAEAMSHIQLLEHQHTNDLERDLKLNKLDNEQLTQIMQHNEKDRKEARSFRVKSDSNGIAWLQAISIELSALITIGVFLFVIVKVNVVQIHLLQHNVTQPEINIKELAGVEVLAMMVEYVFGYMFGGQVIKAATARK